MPVTICTVSAGAACYQQPQRKTFYANSLYWVFYSDGTNMVYRTSADGITWSDPTTVRACTHGAMFSVRHYNIGGVDYVYYAYAANAFNVPVLFCRGTISDSSISWGTEYTIQSASASYRFGYPDVDVGTDNAVYVGYSRGIDGSSLLWVVSRNMNNDGSGAWTVYSYYDDVSLTEGGEAFAHGALTRLTNGRMYTAFTSSVCAWLGGSLWTGSVWSPSSANHETIVDENVQELFGLGSYGDNVYIAYRDTEHDYVLFNLRTYGVGWGSEETVDSNPSTGVHLCVDQSNGDCYAWWGRISVVYYAKRTATWGAAVAFSSEASLFLASITPFWIVTNEVIGVVWTQGFITTNLRYGILSLVVPPPPPPAKPLINKPLVNPILINMPLIRAIQKKREINLCFCSSL